MRRTTAHLLIVALGTGGLLLVGASAAAAPEYAAEGANACLECHETEQVMRILETAHADESNGETPAAKRQCQSCHGPSAKHMQFPMQVANVHFGKGSKASPEVQNQACLECHSEGARADWTASAHGFEKIVCSSCHGIHDPKKNVPTSAAASSGCTSECHGELMGTAKPADFSHGVGMDLGGKGEVGCSDCHNPHGPLGSGRCIDCHAQDAAELAKQTPKAQRFHEVATGRGTECMRCHKGIAHPIPEPELEASRREMEQMLAP